MQDSEHSDGSKKDMGKKTTDAMVYSQHDCMVVGICQKAYVEARQSVQWVSAGHWGRSFQASFRDSSECSYHRGEENFQEK